MALKQDWLLRQTEEWINFLIFLLFGKRATVKEMEALHEKELLNNPFYRQLYQKIEEGDYGIAEDELFDRISTDEGIFKAGILFYSQLNQKTDEELKKGDFTRREVMEGIRDFCQAFGMELPSH